MRVSQTLILIPVLMQVGLTLCLFPFLFLRRARSMKERGQRPNDIALANDGDWSEDARKLANNYKSQFELPVLFYVIALFAYALRLVDVWMLGLAVVFAVSRIVHTLIHVGPNVVLPRLGAFTIGYAAVIAMTVLLFWRVIAAGF